MDAQLVEETCGESYQCKYDYSTTLSREFAIFTKYYQDTFVNIREGKENKDKLAGVARAVKQFRKFRLICADYFKDGLRMGVLVHCVSH